MNKKELIAQVANDTGLSQKDAQSAIEATLNTFATALKKGDDIRLVGFGTFVVSQRAASKGRNPQTGQEINIPASKQVKFRAGKELKETVNS